VQRKGYFEEALNIAYRNTDADMLILTDDDAVPEPNWVKTHLILHKEHPKLGVLGGCVVLQSVNKHYRRKLLTVTFHRAIGFYKPLFKELQNYVSYYNDMGIFVSKNLPLKDGEIKQTMGIIGANMSIKRRVYEDFELPCSTIRGSENEQLLSLHAVLKGFKVFETSLCKVIHLERESLSRPKNLRLVFIEHAVAPYNVYRIYGYVNIYKLRTYLKMLYFIRKLHRREKPYVESMLLAIPIALQAIEENKPPNWVRNKLKELSYRLSVKNYSNRASHRPKM